MSKWTVERARIAALTRSREPDDPQLLEARRNLAFERLREQVESVVRDWPALSERQRSKIVALLNTAGGADETD